MIPSSLTICHRHYTVTLQPTLGALGACDNEGQCITLEQDAHAETQATVLWHEVLEAINASYGLELKHSAINALEAGIYGVLVANPAWWTS